MIDAGKVASPKMDSEPTFPKKPKFIPTARRFRLPRNIRSDCRDGGAYHVAMAAKFGRLPVDSGYRLDLARSGGSRQYRRRFVVSVVRKRRSREG